MKRGEIWRVRLPAPRGHAQAGERPAVIVQNDQVNLSLATRLIVPFTTSASALRFTCTIPILPDGTNGLSLPSVALVFQLTALDKQFFLHRLGVIDPKHLADILAALATLTAP